MNGTTILIALLTLAAGIGAGWSFARAQAAALRAEVGGVTADRDRLRSERAAAEQRSRTAEAELARVEAALEHERAATAEKVALLEQADRRLREAFEALSAEALRRNNEQFVQLAESRLKQATTEAKGDLTQRQEAIASLVLPLRERLDHVDTQLREIEKAREGAYQSLRTSSQQLLTETRQLVSALKAPQVRGRWGELQLQRVVEAAGMVEHCDFVQQETSSTEDGLLRPDLVVKLAGGKNVVVDAKVPFAGYLEAVEARDETVRAARLSAHARHLKTHIDSLATKAYWERFDPSPEFVVCFVPAEAFLQAALTEEPALLEHAFERNVVIATPSTLVALLRTVAYTWRQEALAHNAREVHKLARELYSRLATMGGHIEAVGKSLNTAVTKYNHAVSSLESRVLVTARKLNEMQVVDTTLAAPPQVETLARSVQAPVLVSGDSIVPMPSQKKSGVVAGQESLLDEPQARSS